MTTQAHRWLLELTNLPTAAGQEGRIVQWVERYVARRKHLTLTADRYGNLTLKHKDRQSKTPLYITAHMDHPAFVLREITGKKEALAEFRGGVELSYFPRTRVRLHHGRQKPQRGRIMEVLDSRQATGFGANDSAKLLRVKFDQPVVGTALDVLTWDVGESRIVGDRLHAPGCDDVAGVTAALVAYDRISKKLAGDVRVLLTRAEEVGFIGAIAACKAKSLPRGARLICLENSKSFAESPIGAGPIVRVGDFTSTFDPDLTYRIAQIARAEANRDSTFRWQRKLMPGGTCEASVFQSYGYCATCVCLPLGNYHNMNDVKGRIEAETISVSDFDHLVRLLVAVAGQLDDAQQSPGLKVRLEQLFEQRKHMLDG